MVAKRIGIHELRFEEKDAEIFKIADTKTRLDTLQSYFFPRLEVLLQDTVALVQDIYAVNPYEQMTVTSYYVVHNCVGEGAFVDLSEAFGPHAVSDTMPT